jgi:hypothetical protein
VTDPEGIADAIADAAAMEQRTIDEDVARFDHEAVMAQYVDAYERLVGEYGLFG